MHFQPPTNPGATGLLPCHDEAVAALNEVLTDPIQGDTLADRQQAVLGYVANCLHLDEDELAAELAHLSWHDRYAVLLTRYTRWLDHLQRTGCDAYPGELL